MAQLDLLRQLADGEFHSGEVLARQSGVSRTAVWKQLAGLRELGVELESVRGRGYRIPGGLDLLDADVVRGLLDPAACARLGELLLLHTVDSTNAELLRREPSASGRAQVCTAERQSSGRGRRGRPWTSPFARNLYLSVAWQFEQGAAALEGLSLAVGVAAAAALEACGLPGPQLKWPNDLLYGGRKVGGVLIEMSGDAAGPCRAVVGIGLNVAMPAGLAAPIEQPWTDLASVAAATAPTRNRLLAQLLNELLPLLAEFGETGFGPWRRRWSVLDAHADRPVQVINGNRRLAGTARGVDSRGALQLETTTGTVSLYGGEISLRPLP
jgi:BirA family biotin operon repressor/biotin-[acetyl-CoA-carboxylase] ligase